MSPWLRVRVHLDRAVALLLLVPILPVIAVCALAVRRHDGGPALIRVARVGRAGAPLAMWKIRSMHAQAGSGLAAGPALTSGDDDRITAVGRWLRRYRLDELPQLWHVVRGEMALLGPRPEAPDYVERDDARWQHVLQAPPGIAGLTQVLVNGWEAERLRTATDNGCYRGDILPVKLAVDRWYVRSATPALDIRIALDTLLRRSGRSARVWSRARRAVPELEAVPD